MDKTLLKKKLPYSVAIIGIFLLMASIYFLPTLQGKVIIAPDYINGTAACHEGHAFHEETGEFTWWNSAMFSGMPSYQIGGGRYIIGTVLRPLYLFFQWGARNNPIAIFFFYLIAFYALLRSFKIERWTSVAGAIAISLSSYFFIIISAHHHGKCISITWMTMVLVGFMLICQKRRLLGAALVMLFTIMGLTIHPQMAYYIMMLLGLFFCAELYIHVKEKRMRDFGIAIGIFAGSFLLAFGACSANIFANTEYAAETMRGGHSELVKENDDTNKTQGLDLDYATAWSYGIDETLTFLIPNYMGGASGYDVGTKSELYKELTTKGVPRKSAEAFCKQAPTYWGTQPFTAGPVYVGAIVCFLFVLGLFIVKGPYKWALLTATLFSVLLSWGKNFMELTEFFFNYFPMYNKFRAVSSILIVAEITIPVLAFLALKAIYEDKAGEKETIGKKKLLNYLYISGGITAGICLLYAMFGGTIDFTSPNDASFSDQWWYDGLLRQRAAMLKSDALRSFAFIALAMGVIWLYVQDKLKQSWLATALIVLVTIDMWPVAKRFCNDDNYMSTRERDQKFAIQSYEKQILQDKDINYRVMNLATNTFNDARTSYRLKSIGGYSAAKLRRYQDLIDQHLSKMNPSVLNMLNCRYFIVPIRESNEPVVQRNPEALGNGWYIQQLELVGNANDESDALNHIDVRTTAVVDTSKFAELATRFVANTDSSAQVIQTHHQPNRLEYTAQSSQPGTIVFSEIYYPHGWKVTIDGKEADHYRVNYLLRALPVDAGEHHIVFEFDPDSVKKGNTLSLVCLCMMLSLLATGTVLTYKKRKKEQAIS